jgi:nuclear GTP-binding protein
VVETADVLLQVLDARDPLGSRIHPSVEAAILSKCTNKKMVLVLNKIDLVPSNVVRDWLQYLRRSHPTIAIKASNKSTAPDAVHDDGSTSTAPASTLSPTTPVGMEGLLQLLKNYARTSGPGGGGDNKTTVVVGIIGYPNVGKSSSK